jgi:hypothetical protein
MARSVLAVSLLILFAAPGFGAPGDPRLAEAAMKRDTATMRSRSEGRRECSGR